MDLMRPIFLDMENICNFNLPTIAKFKLSDICIPILENGNSKRSKKPRTFRKINGLDETEQEIIPLAYYKLETTLTNVQPWPDTEETPKKLLTEADEMAGDAWDDSCIALKVSVDPSRKALKMVCYI